MQHTQSYTLQCVLCGCDQSHLVFEARDFDSGRRCFELVQCPVCHLVRTNPVLSGAELNAYYANGYYGGGSKKFASVGEWLLRYSASTRAKLLLKHWRRMCPDAGTMTPRVLDIGCGRGTLLQAFEKFGCRCTGVEHDSIPIDHIGANIDFHKGELRQIGLPQEHFDIIVIWHVLEHLRNPVDNLRQVFELLRPNGLLALAVPNFGSFQSRLFRQHWFHLDLPRHIHHFSPETLSRCLEDVGFLVTSLSTYSLEQNLFGFVQSLENKIGLGRDPNRFYALLRNRGTGSSPWELPLLMVLSTMFMPVAAVEYMLSGVLGAGATIRVSARKGDGLK